MWITRIQNQQLPEVWQLSLLCSLYSLMASKTFRAMVKITAAHKKYAKYPSDTASPADPSIKTPKVLASLFFQTSKKNKSNYSVKQLTFQLQFRPLSKRYPSTGGNSAVISPNVRLFNVLHWQFVQTGVSLRVGTC